MNHIDDHLKYKHVKTIISFLNIIYFKNKKEIIF